MKPRQFVYLTRPSRPADYANALHDIVVSAAKNQLVVYFSGDSHRCPRALLNAAASIPTTLGHLVQVPRDTVANPHRQWNYCIQRA